MRLWLLHQLLLLVAGFTTRTGRVIETLDEQGVYIGEGRAPKPTPEQLAALEEYGDAKESKWCRGEGQLVLYDDAGKFYRPAYPGHRAFGAKCRYEDFEETAVLGEGAFGQVFAAYHKTTGIRVAIKELLKQVDVRHLRREECIQHTLMSPLLCRHFCTISQNGYVSFVLEYIEGTTLYEARKYNRWLPIVSISAQVVLMIQYLHERFILYRDLKPENIMYDPITHRLKLIDFGLATRLAGSTSSTHGQSGTPPFMAPEMFNNYYSYPSEWYAVGLVIYEMIAGRNPFDGIRDRHQLEQHIMHGFDCLLKDKTGCDLIRNMCALRPEDRWGSTPSSLNRIKRHPWFRGIPWDDFAQGNISMLLPRRQRSRRSRNRLARSLPETQISWTSKNPLRATKLSSSESEDSVDFMLDLKQDAPTQELASQSFIDADLTKS